MRNINVLKQPVIQRWQEKDHKKAQSKELLKSAAVSVSQELENKYVRTKKPIERSRSGWADRDP